MTDLRKEARGRECMVRIPGVCNGDPATTVLAHLNGGGMGMKRPDTSGAWVCSACHDAVDGRTVHDPYSWEELSEMHLQGVIRTQEQLIREGKIKW
jgi:hypothetical protein